MNINLCNNSFYRVLYLGRRISNQSTGELVSQQNPDIPVVKQGHWTQRSDTELDQEDNVEKIQVTFESLQKFF